MDNRSAFEAAIGASVTCAKTVGESDVYLFAGITGDLSPNHVNEVEMAAMVSEHDMVRADLGHHVENVGLEDADNVVEELIAEGMDEAVHEQMLAARREQEIEEGEDEEDEAEEA